MLSWADARPSKRRRVEVPSGDKVYSKHASQLQQCSVCSSLFSLSRAQKAQESYCASCNNMCCQRCLSYCDAALILAPQRTPPLLDDDSLSSGSAPSTPNRFSTPEPFDPNVLRARLLSAAAEAAAVQQQRSSVVDRHVLDTEMRVGNGTRAETGLVMGGQNQNHDHHHHVVPHSHAYAFDARFSNNTAHEQAAVLPPLILQQRQELLLVQLQQRPGMPPIQKKRKRTESSMSSSLASYSSAAANSTNAKLSVVSSQHHQQSSRFHSHSARQAPCAFSPIYPSSSCLYHTDARPSALNQTRPSTMLASDVEMDLADDDDKEREEEQHGCNARLCLNCLVQTADGHKVCIPCLEESIMA